MYEVCRKINDEYLFDYIYKSKNSKGQQIVCETWMAEEGGIGVHINFSFYVTTKRKHGYQENITTGKDGLRSLLWAKSCLIDFLRKLDYENSRTSEPFKLIIFASDKRRYEIYKRTLLPLGFKIAYSPYKHFYYA